VTQKEETMAGRPALHIREPDGEMTCLYRSVPRPQDRIPPPCCPECGRTIARRVWSREGWDRWRERVEYLAQQREVREQARRDRATAKHHRGADTPWPNRLREICTRAGLTRRELALKVGSSVRTVEGWWSGRHPPDHRARAILREIWREMRVREVAQVREEERVIAQQEMEETVRERVLTPGDAEVVDAVLEQWTRGTEG
jgi:transcriptional regulator with XRE-family HTH domain